MHPRKDTQRLGTFVSENEDTVIRESEEVRQRGADTSLVMPGAHAIWEPSKKEGSQMQN